MKLGLCEKSQRCRGRRLIKTKLIFKILIPKHKSYSCRFGARFEDNSVGIVWVVVESWWNKSRSCQANQAGKVLSKVRGQRNSLVQINHLPIGSFSFNQFYISFLVRKVLTAYSRIDKPFNDRDNELWNKAELPCSPVNICYLPIHCLSSSKIDHYK